MNNLTRKRNWLITFLCTMALCLCFAFGITLNKPTVNADAQIKTYTVKIDVPTTKTGDLGILSSDVPSATATKVFFEFTVTANTGAPFRFGTIVGDCSTQQNYFYNVGRYFTDISTADAFAFGTVGTTYQVVYNKAGGAPTAINVLAQDGSVASSIAVTSNGAYGTVQGEPRYYGVWYAINTTVGAWNAVWNVKCYDDTNKDLGITYKGYVNFVEDEAENQTLSTASYADTYLGAPYDTNITGISNAVYTTSGLDENFSTIVNAEGTFTPRHNRELSKIGASDTVIVLKGQNVSANVYYGHSIGLRNAISKEAVDAGAEVILRAFIEGQNGYAQYSRFASLDARNLNNQNIAVANAGQFVTQAMQYTGSVYQAPGFTNVRIGNDYVKAMATEDGSFPGFTFYTHSGCGDAIYIDSISYITGEQAATVDQLIADINAIGEVTKEDAAAIAAARATYNALPAEVQAVVTNYATLTAAETALETLKVTVTVNNGQDVMTNKVFIGDKATAPQLQNNGKIFLGWDFNGTLIASGTEITITEDTALTAKWLDYTQTEGASIRLNKTVAQSGIRFETVLTKASYETYANYIKAVGSIVLPTDLVDTEFTLADTDAPNNYVLEKADFVFGEDDALRLNAGLITINQANYKREYSARSYVVVNYGGEDIVLYGDYDEEINARSVYEVATLALDDPDGGYSTEELAILNGYVATTVTTSAEVVVSSKEIALWA